MKKLKMIKVFIEIMYWFCMIIGGILLGFGKESIKNGVEYEFIHCKEWKNL